MENITNYTCVCGKMFDDKMKYAGHSSHCTVHLLNKYGTLQPLIDADNQRHRKTKETMMKKATDLRKQQIDDWVAEQHHCEKCGKLMTEKFGSGRFCSKSCANSRVHSNETKEKISQSLMHNENNHYSVIVNDKKYECREDAYNDNPKYCVICGAIIPYKHRNRNTCGETCYHKLLGRKASQNVANAGGNLNPHPNKNCKYGRYQGIRCDSTYELAFVVYNMDMGRKVSRCKNGFPYSYSGKKHTYYPDFVMDGIIYEIKNYFTPLVDAKAKAVPQDIAYKLILKEEMTPYIEYCRKKYGKCFWEVLYDK